MTPSLEQPVDPRWRSLMRRLALGSEAALLLTGATLGVSVLGPRRLMRLIGTVDRPGALIDAASDPASAGPTGPRGHDREAIAGARQTGRAVARVARVLPWRPVCLPQAIAVRAMLRRRGVDAVLHLGLVSLEPLAAHAWVTVDGAVVSGAGTGPVTELARFVPGPGLRWTRSGG